MNSIKEGHICRPPEAGTFFWNFYFYFPGARHDGRAVFGGSEAEGEAEVLGWQMGRDTVGLLRKTKNREQSKKKKRRKEISG